jgi:protein-tyrosine phosphatase
MAGWIDLHSHVLPGIDDGAQSLDDALAMAALAERDGTAVLAATPHVREDHPEVVPGEIAERVARLNGELEARGVGLQVVAGGEVGLLDALDRPEEELRAVTLGGGGTLLVETPHGPLPPNFERLLSTVAARGFRVLLAHPEHSPDVQRQPERLAEVVEAGILLQLTGGSLASPRRAPWHRAAAEILKRGWAHVLASDAHSATWRRPLMTPGIDAGERALRGSRAELEWMARDVPAALLAGESLPPRPEREAATAGGLIGRLMGR